jgi:hypothetical protein
MERFGTGREAKEFVVGRIVAEAEREGVSLSEVERKMLYFSETAWTLPDMMEVNAAFDREYDQEEYEQKIGSLCRSFCEDARTNNPDDFDTWKDAVRVLRKEDHYVLVLIDAGGGSAGASKAGFPASVLMGACAAALVWLVVHFWWTR